MYKFWTFFIRKRQFSLLLVVVLVFIGLWSAYQIPKESTPDVEVGIGVVMTIAPGASPADMERFVTDVLEEPLRSNLKDVRKITSTSSEGLSYIVVEFLSEADFEKGMRDLRNEINQVKPDLLAEAKEPVISEIDLTNDPVITATISSNAPREILFSMVEEFKEELEELREVSSVALSGVTDYEVSVLLQRSVLTKYGIDLLDVVNAIKFSNAPVPIGSIQNDGVEYSVRFTGGISDYKEIENITITSPEGKTLYLRDLATVRYHRGEESALARTSVDGNLAKYSAVAHIFKSSSVNITEAAKVIERKISDMQSTGGALEDAEVLIMFNEGEMLWKDLSTLIRSAVQTTLLVVLVLIMAIGWREALIAGVAIPLSFLFAFIALYYSGNTINFVSLFALVLAVGIIVDSAIVITEGINKRIKDKREEERSINKEFAAEDAVKEFHIPLLAGTATTVVVFAPLFLVSGIVGEFIKSIPFTIIFVLMASLFVALAMVPFMAASFLKRRKYAGRISKIRRRLVIKMQENYGEYLRKFLSDERKLNYFFATLAILFVFALSLPFVGAIKVIFFGGGDSEYIFIDVEMPYATTLNRTDLETRKIEEILYQVPQIESFVTNVGSLSPFTQLASSIISGERYANIFITLNEKYKSESAEIMDYLRDNFSKINTSTISADQLNEGPPNVAPIVITYMGENFEDLDIAAKETVEVLQSIEGVTDVKSDTRNKGVGIVLEINRAKASLYGVSALGVGGNLRGALSGSDAGSIKINGKDVDIKVRIDNSDKEIDLEELMQTPVRAQSGVITPSLFLNVSAEENRSAITHYDGRRSVTITAKLTKDGNLREALYEFKKKIRNKEIPNSVSMKIGGENEDFEKSFKDMFMAFLIGLVSMFGILILQFNSVRYALYVLLAVPLSLIGVFGGLMLVGEPISFPSLMGFIALSGIVVNNAIIMIDTMNRKRLEKEDEDLKIVVTEAAVERLRPVLLTAITTVIGIAPLLFAASIWIPLAYAIMFGLSFSTIITLVLIPAIYCRWPGKARLS